MVRCILRYINNIHFRHLKLSGGRQITLSGGSQYLSGGSHILLSGGHQIILYTPLIPMGFRNFDLDRLRLNVPIEEKNSNRPSNHTSTHRVLKIGNFKDTKWLAILLWIIFSDASWHLGCICISEVSVIVCRTTPTVCIDWYKCYCMANNPHFMHWLV